MNYEMLYKLCENPTNTINKLPLNPNDFFYFLFPGKLNENFYTYDKNEYKEKRNVLLSVFGDSGAEILHNIGMAFALKYESKKKFYTEPNSCFKYIDDIYKEILKLPMEILTKSIGVGYTGVVFPYQDKKVVKLMFNTLIENEIKFLSFQKKNRRVLFPEIYEYTKDFIVMEKLETKSRKLLKIREEIQKCIVQKTICEVSYREVNPKFMNCLSFELEKLIQDIRKEFVDIFKISSIGDLKGSNIGERLSTGEIVYFDPIGVLIKES